MSGGLSRNIFTKCKGKVDPVVVEQIVLLAEEISTLNQALTEMAKQLDHAVGLIAYNNELHQAAFKSIDRKLANDGKTKEIPR